MSKKTIYALLLLATLALFLPVNALAKISFSKNNVSIPETQIINDDLFISANVVSIKGTINGDVYTAGGMVDVSGNINGDLLAAGGILHISGNIKDDVRAIGANIDIAQANIGDSLTAFGGNVSIDHMTSVNGAIIFGSGAFISKANVSRSIYGSASTANLDGSIGKNVYINADTLTLGPNTDIYGDLVYSSPKEFITSQKSNIQGNIHKLISRPNKYTLQPKTVSKKFKLGFKIWSYLSSLIIGFLILYFFPQTSQKIADSMLTLPLQKLLWGAFCVILLGPVLLILLLSGIGIPLALILILLFTIELIIARSFVGIALGLMLKRISNLNQNRTFLFFSLGLALYSIITLLPTIGPIIRLTAFSIFFGAVFQLKKQYLHLS